jgi:fluoroacetyl-CoA thioesterase
MEVTEYIQPGMVREDTYTVEGEHSAAHIGSGSVSVLATPWMIAFMERTARDLMAERLPAGFSSVGVVVNIRHLAPTPVGSRVRVRAEVQSAAGVRVVFTIQVWDEQELAGDGLHERVVIEEARFMRRVEAKRG